MPNANRPEEVPLEDMTEEYSFDELARGLATGTLSRRKALKLVGAALLGGALGFFSLQGRAEGQACVGAKIDNDRCVANRCGGTRRRPCFCAETVAGNKRCVNLQGETCPSTDQCDSNADCPVDELCINIGGCCGNPGRNLCVRRCG